MNEPLDYCRQVMTMRRYRDLYALESKDHKSLNDHQRRFILTLERDARDQ